MTVDEHFWPRLIGGHLGSFQHEYMVSIFTFDTDWTSWEMHPNGDEVVCLLSGQASLVLEAGGGQQTVELRDSGGFVLVPRGVWHTARTSDSCRMLFITAGQDTQHRPA